jgi:hypothetical protein
MAGLAGNGSNQSYHLSRGVFAYRTFSLCSVLLDPRVHGAAGGALHLVHCQLRIFLLLFKTGLLIGYTMILMLGFSLAH